MKRMSRFFISLSVVAVLCACSLTGKSADNSVSVAGSTTSASGQTVATEKQLMRLDTVSIESKNIASPAKFVIALPTEAVEGSVKEFPVVYVLHGFAGNYSDWSKHTDLTKLADRYGVILVCPDGRDSWYWDSPLNPTMQMESYIIDELIPYVDDNYPTLIEPESRAVTGLSMGGHGALWLAMRHPDVFTNAGSMSGGVDIVKFPDKWAMHKSLGKYADNLGRWQEHSVMSLVPGLKKGELNIIFDCGEQDFFYKVNNDLDVALTKAGIEHKYSHRPGKHSWAYWVESLPQHLEFFKANFDRVAE